MSENQETHAAGSRPPCEVELKLDVAATSTLDALRELGDLSARYPMGPVESRRLSDTYLDTSDYRLLRNGLVLRLRRSDAGTRLTLKGLAAGGEDGLFRRPESELILDDGRDWRDAAAWPEALRATVLEHAGELGALGPICQVEHARDVRAVRTVRAPLAARADAHDGPVVAELALETLEVSRPAPAEAEGDAGDDASEDSGDRDPPQASQPAGGFAEVELEFSRDSTPDDVHYLARWLGERRGVTPLRAGKLERALCLIADHPPGAAPGDHGIAPDMPMAEAGRHAWRVQLVRILLEEAGARRGEDIEYVHRMRVATRRARAAYKVFGDHLDPEAVRPLVRGLRRTTRRLGKVRDLDVALAKLAAYQAELPDGDTAGLDALAQHWHARRRATYRKLLDWLDGERYADFLVALDRFCRRPGAGVAPPPGGRAGARTWTVAHVMPAAILERYATVRSYEDTIAAAIDAAPASAAAGGSAGGATGGSAGGAAGGAAGGTRAGTAAGGADEPPAAGAPTETLMHALRIDCKRLRYSLEFVRHLLGNDGRTLIKQLRRLQDHLGDLNDAVVARDRLITGAPELREESGVRRYRERQEEIVARLIERFPTVWETFIARENRAVLMRALATL